jgi:hypothetical protein
MSSWLGLLTLMMRCVWVPVYLHLGRCIAVYVLSRRIPGPVLLALPLLLLPLGVLQPQPHWGDAWSPICFFYWTPSFAEVRVSHARSYCRADLF